MEGILHSKSKYASFILGYMLNTMIKMGSELMPKYVILADALPHMFDYDIRYINYLGDYYNNRLDAEKDDKGYKEKFYIDEVFMHILEEKEYDLQDISLTIDKCISYQIMSKNTETITKLDLSKVKVGEETEDYYRGIYLDSSGTIAKTFVEESYTLTNVGDFLYDIICSLGIEE